MLNGYKIIDVDSHVTEPPDMWERYIEPAFRNFAPSAQQLDNFPYKIPAQFRKRATQQLTERHPRAVMSGFDPESHIFAMQQMGVDVSFVYPNQGLWVLAVDSMAPALAGALTRAYNNWLKDFCAYNPQMLRGVGAINLHAPEEMIPELKRIAEFGWQAVFLRPNPTKGRLLSDPAYEAFWSECEKLNIAVGIHASTHGRVPTTGIDRFNTEFAMNACSHTMEQMMALLALIEGGVLERHPQLKVGFLEAGCGWLLHWLWKLDAQYEDLYWEVKENVKKKPSQYFQEQCFTAIEPSEPYLSQVIELIGSDNLMFGSDYPHVDHDKNIAQETVNLQNSLSDKVVEKVLWENPARFYGLETQNINHKQVSLHRVS